MILRREGVTPNGALPVDGLLSFAGNNPFTLTIDGTAPGHPDIVNQITSGLRISSIDANTGRGILTFPPIPAPPCNPGLPCITLEGVEHVIYIIGTNQFVSIYDAVDPQ